MVGRHTFNVSNALLQNLLEDFGILELFRNLGNDGVCKLFLLSGFDLAFVPYPRVEDSFCFCCQRRLLLQLKGLRLELGRFLS